MGKPKTVHHFTLNGNKISGRFLSGTLGIANCKLYEIANRIESDEGNDIAKEVARELLHEGREAGDTMEWNGETCRVVDVADELGISRPTFKVRIKKYGVDCCYTYFPGKIPISVLPPKKKRTYPTHIKQCKGTAEWKGMSSSTPRVDIASISGPGTWEENIPCPPAGSGSVQDYVEPRKNRYVPKSYPVFHHAIRP